MCIKAVTSGSNHEKKVKSEKYDYRKRILQHQIYFIRVLLISCFIRSGSCWLTSTPSDVAILSGRSFNLRCLTNTTEDLAWYRLIPGSSMEDHIVEGSQVNDRFRSFYSVLHEKQESNLMIRAVQSTAARYACVEIYTTERATAQVTVLESEPSCLGNLTRDGLNFTCVVTFSGHVNPVIKWTKVTGKEEKEVTVGIANIQNAAPLKTITSTLTVQTSQSERNRFPIYSYRYTVTFCAADTAKDRTNGQVCVFSQLLSIGEDVTGTTSTSATDGTGSVPWWIVFVIPLVGVSLISLIVGYYCYRRAQANKPHGEAALVPVPV